MVVIVNLVEIRCWDYLCVRRKWILRVDWHKFVTVHRNCRRRLNIRRHLVLIFDVINWKRFPNWYFNSFSIYFYLYRSSRRKPAGIPNGRSIQLPVLCLYIFANKGYRSNSCKYNSSKFYLIFWMSISYRSYCVACWQDLPSASNWNPSRHSQR